MTNSQFDGTKNCFLVSDIIPISGLWHIKVDKSICSFYIFPKNSSLKSSKLYLGMNDIMSDTKNGPSNWELVNRAYYNAHKVIVLHKMLAAWKPFSIEVFWNSMILAIFPNAFFISQVFHDFPVRWEPCVIYSECWMCLDCTMMCAYFFSWGGGGS